MSASGILAAASAIAWMSTNTYIRSMPRSASSSATPDLFDHMPSMPQRTQRALPKAVAPLPDVGSLSDARLARLLVEAASEVQRRKVSKVGRQSRPELDQALQEAEGILRATMPKRSGRRGGARTADAAPALQEGKRKAIRTALQAGVAPGQVARHFGLSLAAVRKALTDES